MALEKIHKQAFAKINFSLSVGSPALRSQAVGSQGGGALHPIISHMAKIHLCDEVELTKLESHALSRYAVVWHEDAPKTSEINWVITSDLAVKAHRMLEQKVGRTLPVQMKLEKRIPVGSGLGGGSADAAAMLQGIAEMFQLDVDLYEIAHALGSDVSFFLCDNHAIVFGTGEHIEPIPASNMDIVIIIPSYACQTAEVFSAFDELGGGQLEETMVRDGEIFNDLTIAACKTQPSLERDMQQLCEKTGKIVHLTGSGSAMFAICDNEPEAKKIAKKIEENTDHVALATQTCT